MFRTLQYSGAWGPKEPVNMYVRFPLLRAPHLPDPVTTRETASVHAE